MKATDERRYRTESSKRKNMVKDGRGSILVRYMTDVDKLWAKAGLV